MKKISFMLLWVVLGVCMFSCLPVYAANDEIKVGLLYKYKNVTSLGIRSNQLAVGYDDGSGFVSAGNISSANGFGASVSSQYYVKVEQVFSDYSGALSLASTIVSSGYKACPALVETGKWTVYAGGFATSAEAEAAKLNIGLAASVAAPRVRAVLDISGTAAVVFDNATRFGQIKNADDSPISLGEMSYRGRIELNVSGNTLTPVNVLPTEEYLYGVLPAEIVSTWNIEALKAQAVASRTYTYTKISSHVDSGYNVCDLSHCQNYRGAAAETAATTKAVNDTRGVMAYYNNQKIEAMYHAAGGGYTEGAENVWANNLPYLKAVKELDGVNEKTWTRTFTLQEIGNLAAKNNLSVGAVNRVRVSVNPQSSRVQELILEGTAGTKTVTKEAIRTFFSSTTGGPLDSRLFAILGAGQSVSSAQTTSNTDVYIKTADTTVKSDFNLLSVINQNGDIVHLRDGLVVVGSGGTQAYGAVTTPNVSYASSGDNVTFVGKGFGHGVGMSQYGAANMADRGYRYDEILKFYYTGVDIK